MGASATRFSDIPIIWFCIFGALVAAGMVWRFLQGKKRRKALQEYAQIHQLTYLGNAIPHSLGLERLSVWHNSDAVENLILGSDIALFDFVARRGKRSSKQTVVAFKSPDGNRRSERASHMSAGLFIERLPEWTVCFQYKRLISAMDLGHFIQEMRQEVAVSFTHPSPVEGATGSSQLGSGDDRTTKGM
jgi:hypothetical protein